MRVINKLALFFSMLALAPLASTFAGFQSISTISAKAKQNVTRYAGTHANRLLISKKEQATFTKHYLAHYFSPWNNSADTKQILADQHDSLSSAENSDFYQYNFHRVSQAWLTSIKNNMDLNHFHDLNRNAIIVKHALVRTLPTAQPMFYKQTRAGQGYPFDNLQESALWVGAPIKVVHFSADKRYALIESSQVDGWILTEDLGFVNNKFIHRFKTSPLVAVVKDDQPIAAGNQYNVIQSRVGMLLPKIKHKVMMPTLDSKHNAILAIAVANHSLFQNFPLPMTKDNLAKIMNQMLGAPYGWGGLYDERDCSFTVMDTFAPFGLWLPRNSQAALKAHHYVSLDNMDSQQKLNFIEKHAHPFETLLGTSSHIVIYLGMKNGTPYIFQSKWGAHTADGNKAGRAVLGEVAVTPLQYDKQVPYLSGSLLQRMNKMTSAV